MKKSKSKTALYILLCTVAAAAGLAFLQRLLVPKYMEHIREGVLIEEYYASEKDHDVIFIGDCEVYENISPITLWQEYGITSYIRGSAAQLVPQSYYIMEETFRYEKPEVVVFNVMAMMTGEQDNEAYNRMTMDGMKLSMQKLKAIEATKMKDESLLSYLFPLLRYHSRWSELTADDITYYFQKEQRSHNGYLMRADVKPAAFVPEGKKLADYSLPQENWDYLDRMRELCEKNGAKLLLIKVPSVYPYFYPEWDKQYEEYARKNGLGYLNLLNNMEEAGIDMTVDTYDSGLHLNLYGAEKLAVYLGRILREDYGLGGHKEDSGTAAVWKKKTEAYEAEKEKQLREIAELGYLKSYGARPAAE